MKEALLQSPEADGTVRCGLCPHFCRIAPGRRGFCQVRSNQDGVLYAESYRRPAALQIDPIEKKPFHWFLPGTKAFSIGTFGCNLSCRFCQNDHLSRHGYETWNGREFAPEEIVALAREHHCRSIAFTYNEPTVFIEYALEIAALARSAGVAVLLVSNGMISRKGAELLYPWIDAANIDLKGNDRFYRELCQGELSPVLDNCEYLKKVCHAHLELTTLVVPRQNDDPAVIDSLLETVARRLGVDTPLHFSACYPTRNYTEALPTPKTTLFRIREQAQLHGFTRISLGNI